MSICVYENCALVLLDLNEDTFLVKFDFISFESILEENIDYNCLFHLVNMIKTDNHICMYV